MAISGMSLSLRLSVLTVPRLDFLFGPRGNAEVLNRPYFVHSAHYIFSRELGCRSRVKLVTQVA